MQNDAAAALHDTDRMVGRTPAMIAIAAAVIAIGAGAFLMLHTPKAPLPPRTNAPVTSEVQAQSIFFVSDRDLDPEATESAKAALKEGRIPPVLANVPERTRKEVLSGEQSLYSVRLVDFLDEDGDWVKISINDALFGELLLSNAGAKLTIPLKKGTTTKFTCTASRDGGGGVTFRAISSTGEMRTRVMAVGECESWTISFK